MWLSSAAQCSTLLVVAAAIFTAEAQPSNRITVRSWRTNYRIDTWGDGRADPYRVTFWKDHQKTVLMFFIEGGVKSLAAGDTLYTYEDLPPGPVRVAASSDDIIEDVESDTTAAIDCDTCDITREIMCDVGLKNVCVLDAINPDDFDEVAKVAVSRFCGAIGAACIKEPDEFCTGQCQRGLAVTTTAPKTTKLSAAKPFESSTSPVLITTSASTAAPTVAPAADTIEPTTGEPTPASIAELSECNPNPCEFGGSCTIDPAGGHTCSCTNDYGGMSCQIDTSNLDPFFIEIDFVGAWTDARRAVFQSAADRWSQVITHVSCGGTTEYPAGRLRISATLEELDGPGFVLGSAGPTSVWKGCNTISAEGKMTFDLNDISFLEADGSFEGVVLHEMGHVIGIGTLWGNNFGECTACRQTDDPTWLCPAALSTYADIGGTDADIVELDGEAGASCTHLDETIFQDELMTGFIDNPMLLSKMTAAILEDIAYVVDSSMVDAYFLPAERGASIYGDAMPRRVNDTAVDIVVRILDEDGDVFDEVDGIGMQF